MIKVENVIFRTSRRCMELTVVASTNLVVMLKTKISVCGIGWTERLHKLLENVGEERGGILSRTL